MAFIFAGGEQPPQSNRTRRLHKKMLTLAEDLLLEEMTAGTLLACGDSFTSKFAGQYGLYETLNGEIVSFKPKPNLDFTLINDEFVATSKLMTIKMIAHHVDEYDLSVAI